MPSTIGVALDTTGPASASLHLDAGVPKTTSPVVSATLTTTDKDQTNYQMKVWGDVDLAWGKANGFINGASTTTLEADALWVGLASPFDVKLSSGDGEKTVSARLRDAVHNVSAAAQASIQLATTNTQAVSVNPSGAAASVSNQSGEDAEAFSFESDGAFVAYAVMAVASPTDTHDAGVQIPTTNGSTNVSGAGSFAANTPISVSVKAEDLALAAPGDAPKVIKVFVQDATGAWSV